MKPTQTSEFIPCLEREFSVHGIPREIKNDNELSFNPAEFANYIQALEIKHQPVTPLWPQSNARVDRINQFLKKALKTARLEGRV